MCDITIAKFEIGTFNMMSLTLDQCAHFGDIVF